MAEYKTLVKKIPVSPDKKTKQKDYLKKGRLPIVDQGQSLVGGYTDDADMAVKCELPVIVFGDHTRAVKYITFPFGAGADGIKVLQPKENILPPFLYYGTQYIVAKMPNRGYARHYQYVEKEDLPIPSLPEQERIVARIEELFSQLDAGVETLKKTKAQLAVYRQAVLKEAFEGRLTASGPEKIVRLGDYIETPRYGTSKKCSYDDGRDRTAVYRIPNIEHKNGRISHDDIKYAQFTESELDGIRLQQGDILIIRSNGSVSLVGRAAMVCDADITGTFAGYLMRLRISEPETLLPKFLLLFLQSHQARIYIENKAKSTSGVHNINSTEISDLQMPLYDPDTQYAIIEAIESRLSVCDSIEHTVGLALQQAEAMRQSILKDAFEGKL